ncbi:MAG: asparagine synthetase B [Gemmatimonadetes bacterium]|nr:asparagine synthetase B [Gemmatimonadota bacterium]
MNGTAWMDWARRGTAVRRMALVTALLGAAVRSVPAQHLLVPMDDSQQNHLKAYGLTFGVLKAGGKAEWFLNYKGGSFLLPDDAPTRRRAAVDGITVQPLDDGAVTAIRREVASSNMDAVTLEKAPRIAIYAPAKSPPWDDAVTLALKYAGIEFTQIWDDEVLKSDLGKFDWIHLFHEDFTGQLNKLYLGFRDAGWFMEQRDRDLATAQHNGFQTIPALKKAVAWRLHDFVQKGGFLFAMCGATETIELAMAAQGVDIAGPFSDGTPVDPDADSKMDWTSAFAFQGVHLEMSSGVNAMSDIDGHQVNVPARRQALGMFTLFNFSAKFDPVATMLTQNHRKVIPDYYGVTTSFNRAVLKSGVTVLASEDGSPWAKYLHGDFGRGSWTYLGGHDPEDPQHNIGAAPTDLGLHTGSPGYRLILNNVLFPAAKKKPLKT